VNPGGPWRVQTKNGFSFPDPKCTPGAIKPDHDSARDQRQRVSRTALEIAYRVPHKRPRPYDAYGIPHPAHNTGTTQICELDHLIPLEMGGADTVDNIWPQCGPDGVALRERFFKQKDMVENYLTAQVKSGQRSLETSQRGIAKDWTQYLDKAKSFCGSRKCAGEK